VNKKQYSELLKTKEWKEFSLLIKERDGFRCKKCGCKENLHSHHKVYIKGNKPWEYDKKHLETLCSTCHKNEHKGKKISDFILKKKNKKSKRIKMVLPESEIKRNRLKKQRKLNEKPFQIKLEKSEEYYMNKKKRGR